MSDETLPWWDPKVLDRERWGGLVEPTLERVIRARDRNRLPHALLLVGPAGLGRELAAVEAAALVVCEEAERPWSESGCARRLRVGHHPDVEAVLPQGRKNIIKIDRIREIVDSSRGRPFEGKRRVWIFDGVEAEFLHRESANAFLKTLEEPPAHVFLIMLAANPMAVLPTIRSRCQQLTMPGSVAVARELHGDAAAPELASAGSAEDVAEAVVLVKQAISAGLDGDTLPLLRLPYALPAGVKPFAAAAAGAIEMAGEAGGEGASEGLVRLAAELTTIERRARSLNLERKAQMVSCLLRWQRELGV